MIFFYPLSGLGKPLERLMHKGHFRKLSEEQGELLRVKAAQRKFVVGKF